MTGTGDAASEPGPLALRSPREEFLAVAAARLARAESEGALEEARRIAAARELGAAWLPDRPGGSPP